MPEKDNLSALIERIEAADGPSRHIDTQIDILLDPDAEQIIGHEKGRFPRKPIYGPRMRFWEWACDEGREPPVYRGGIPQYTASLDAARTLVPEGWDWGLAHFGSRGCEAQVWPHNRRNSKRKFIGGGTPNTALALCAAALRAHRNGEKP